MCFNTFYTTKIVVSEKIVTRAPLTSAQIVANLLHYQKVRIIFFIKRLGLTAKTRISEENFKYRLSNK